ncbi:bifunctional PIG-L family deacetylase/class I SAM-dependent methyltransferase [uncultured Nocardioides sp.]|uniref:bifunctional PIG-L family deacetylase/class I SAM-dependent methyltransferase n=1 Tax=uncultured Nocardioides sp. TaxID=198441 RepID=UPI002639397D|nr:bifunctional PIG-L family deacetylase/class I SAM-dependent methyltransferase [uncultured Nocardioides sp.]
MTEHGIPPFRHDERGTPAAAWDAYAAQGPDLDWTHDGRPLRALVVVAAHPDDETLGAGGLVHTAHRRGLDVRVLVATAGEGSHPGSPTHTPQDLAVRRAAELVDACALLAPGAASPVLLGLPDGAVAAHHDDLVARVVDAVGDGRDTLLAATWRHDGHPDHEAVGRAAAAAAVRTGARLLEYPVWAWHWGTPGDLPTDRVRLRLDPAAVTAKAAAVAAHTSQVAPLSDAPGDATLMGADLLAHFTRDVEVLLPGPPYDDALDALHRDVADPWGVDRRFYERRKRALLLAALPREGFRRGAELGCSTGALGADLAARCDVLDLLDASPVAVAAARERLAGREAVTIREARLPDGWPDDVDGLDLVVVSEVGYFLSPVALERLVDVVAARLREDGVVVLCHWRHPVHGWVLDAAAVHAAFTTGLARSGRTVIGRWTDRDVELLVLGPPSQAPDPGA